MGIKQNVRPFKAGKVWLLMMKDIKVFCPSVTLVFYKLLLEKE
jgi:hypothetical protein